jgi:hypothetical protein
MFPSGTSSHSPHRNTSFPHPLLPVLAVLALTIKQVHSSSTSPLSQQMANLPPFLSKAFKLTPAAKQTMAANNNDQGRVCELDPTNNNRVLTWTIGQSDSFDEMRWSQRKLYEAAQNSK